MSVSAVSLDVIIACGMGIIILSDLVMVFGFM